MEQLQAFVLFVLVAGITPGPNNIMIMTSGLNHGLRASVPHYLGICIGFPVMFYTMGFGLGFVFEQYPLVHKLIQFLGVIFLLYLAIQIANAAPLDTDQPGRSPLSFFEAALFQWLNPKAWTTSAFAIATYSGVGAEVISQILLMGAIFFLFTFPCAGVWLIFGLGLKKLFGHIKYQRIFNWSMAVLLIISVLPISLDLLGILEV